MARNDESIRTEGVKTGFIGTVSHAEKAQVRVLYQTHHIERGLSRRYIDEKPKVVGIGSLLRAEAPLRSLKHKVDGYCLNYNPDHNL